MAFAEPGGAPGLYMIDTDPAGERRFTYSRGQSAARLWLPALEAAADDIADADLVYLSGIGLAILRPEERVRAIAFIRALGARIAFDPNVRSALWEGAEAMVEITTAACAAAAIVLPSLDDAEALWGGRDPHAHIARLLAGGARGSRPHPRAGRLHGRRRLRSSRPRRRRATCHGHRHLRGR